MRPEALHVLHSWIPGLRPSAPAPTFFVLKVEGNALGAILRIEQFAGHWPSRIRRPGRCHHPPCNYRADVLDRKRTCHSPRICCLEEMALISSGRMETMDSGPRSGR